MKNLKKFFKTGALSIMAVAMAASMSTIAFADPATGSFIKADTTAGQDWEGTYGKDGYLVIAGVNGGGSTTTVYTDIYQDVSSSTIVYGMGNYGYKTAYCTDNNDAANTAVTLKEDAVISKWAVSGGSCMNTAPATKLTLYAPGTTTPTNACMHNSGNAPWYLFTGFKTEEADLYVTVYVPQNWESTPISETDYVDVGLYAGQCPDSQPVAWTAFAALTELATTKVEQAGTYVTFKTGAAGDYTIVLGSESDGVAAGKIKPMLGGVFFDKTVPVAVPDVEFVSNAGYDKIGSDWSSHVGSAGYMIPTAGETKTEYYYTYAGIQALATSVGTTAPTEANSMKMFNGGRTFDLVGVGTVASEGANTWTEGEGSNIYKSSVGDRGAYSDLFTDADVNGKVVFKAEDAFLHQYTTGYLNTVGGYDNSKVVKDIYTNCNTWSSNTNLSPYIPGTSTQVNARAMGNRASATYQSNSVNCYAGYSFTTTQDNVYVTIFVVPEGSATALKDSETTVALWKDKNCNFVNNGAGAYLEEQGNLGCSPIVKEVITSKGGYFTFKLNKAGTYFIGVSAKNADGAYKQANIPGLFFDTTEPSYGPVADFVVANTYEDIGGAWESYNGGTAGYGKQGYLIATLDGESNPAYYNKGIFVGEDAAKVSVTFNNKLDGTHCWGVMTPAGGYADNALIKDIAVNCNVFNASGNRTPYAPGTTTEPGVRVQGNGGGYLGYSFTATQANVYVTMYVLVNGSSVNTFTVSAFANYTLTGRQTNTNYGATGAFALPVAQATTVVENTKGAYVTFKFTKAGNYFIGATVPTGSVVVPALFVDTTAPVAYEAPQATQTAEYVSYNRTLSGNWEGTYGSAGYVIFGSDPTTPSQASNENAPFAYTKNIFTGVDDGAKISIINTNDNYGRILTVADHAYSGAIISALEHNNITYRYNGGVKANSPFVPGTETGEQVPGQVATSSNAHVAAINFTITEDAFNNYADNDGYIYVTMYNAFTGGFSQESTVFRAAVYRGKASITNVNIGAWYDKGAWKLDPLATGSFVVRLNTGYYFTFKISGAGEYTIATCNNLGANTPCASAIFFDSAAPANQSPVETIPNEIVPVNGNGTAEYVQIDKYAVSDWASTYGADGYVILGNPVDPNKNSIYSTNAANVYVKGMLGDGSALAMVGNVANQTGGGVVSWTTDFTIAPNAIFDRVYITGSLYRGNNNIGTGLYVPGTANKITIETGSSAAADEVPFGIVINKVDDADMYITMYMYPNSYNAGAQENIYTIGVLSGKYTDAFGANDYTMDGDEKVQPATPVNTLRYQAMWGDKLAEEKDVDVAGGKYVTFKVTGTGLYTFYAYAQGSVKNGACVTALFFDKEQPIYNKPTQVINNTNLFDENQESMVETYFGSAAKINATETVGGDVFTLSNLSATQASFEIGGTTKYYTSILLSKGGSTLKFYRDYTTGAVDGDEIFSYTVPQGDVPVMATFKIADSFTVVVDGDATLQGVYFDNGLPSTYKYKEIGQDKATGSDWEGVYGSAGYFIPYFNTDETAIDFYTGDNAFITSMDYKVENMTASTAMSDAETNVAANSSSYLRVPGSADLINCWMKGSSDGATLYGFKITDEVERFVTLSLYQYWKESWGYTNPAYAPDIVVEVFAGDDIATAATMRAVSRFVVEDVDYNAYLTFKAQGSFVVKVSLAKDSNNVVIGNNASVEGIFFDTENPVPTTYKASIDKTANIVVNGRMYAKAGEDISFKIVDVTDINNIEQELDYVKVGTEALSEEDGVYTITNVTANVTVSIASKAKAAVAPTVALSDDLYADTNGSFVIVTLTAGTNVQIISSGIVIDGLKFKTGTTAEVLVYAIGLDGDGDYIGGFENGDPITYKGYVTYRDLTDNKTYTVYSDEQDYTLNDDADLLEDEGILLTAITRIESLTAPTDGFDYTITLSATTSTVKYNKFTVIPQQTGAHGNVTYTYRIKEGTGAWSTWKALPTNRVIDGLSINKTYTVELKVVDSNNVEATYTLTQATATTVDYTINLSVSEDEVTSDSIAIIAAATRNEGATKYFYKIGDGEWIETSSAGYIFEDLTASTEYTITVRVVDSNGAEATKSITVSTAAAPKKGGCGGSIAMLSAFMGIIALAVVGKKY